jgi:aminomethyltransferase
MPLRTSLHDFHRRHGARFVSFGGWEMPVQYGTILAEHRAVRERAGLFDVSHMGEFHVQGPEAEFFLDRLLVNRIAGMAPGKAVYSPMCKRDGGVVDDLIVYRLEAEAFLVCVNAGNAEKDLGWMLKQAARWKLDVAIADRSEDYALLALQGPEAEAILVGSGIGAAAGLGRFRHRTVPRGSAKLRLCRTGYTGEDGFEIYLPPPAAEAFAADLLEKGEERGLRLCGLGARDSLRLEAGLPLYGHEIDETITPLEAGLGWTVKFDKDDFIGKRALSEQREAGIPRRLVHFRLEGRRIARQGQEVLGTGGRAVGAVCSGTLSPMTGGPIGSALVEAGASDADLAVDLRGNTVPLQVAKPPLHRD